MGFQVHPKIGKFYPQNFLDHNPHSPPPKKKKIDE